MKKLFREYNKPTEAEIKKVWKEAFFVFDTNTLLNMYRYSKSTQDQYFKLFEDLKKQKRLWIPNQVGLEFHRNRTNVICEYASSYDKITTALSNSISKIKGQYKNHPILDFDELEKKLKEIEEIIKKGSKKHPDLLNDDKVLKKINILFNGCVGDEYQNDKLKQIYKEGEERYKDGIPPGFKDKAKDGNGKYGDLILWFQIIDKAITENKPVIFVSDDAKDDWWLDENGKKIMPLPSLRKEMYEKANVEFLLYSTDRFLDRYNSLMGAKKRISSDAIKEIKSVKNDDNGFLLNGIKYYHYKPTNSSKNHVNYRFIDWYSNKTDNTNDIYDLISEICLYVVGEESIPNGIKDKFMYYYEQSHLAYADQNSKVNIKELADEVVLYICDLIIEKGLNFKISEKLFELARRLQNLK